MSTAIAVPNPNGLAVRHELAVEDVIAQVEKIQLVMAKVMKEGEHYGVIPGTNKPTLLKPGAEKLLLTFRFDPQYESTETYEGKHLTIKSKCVLWHIPTSLRMGSGEGSCSTKEVKYAYREQKRTCPKCGLETINKSKYPPRSNPKAEPGWYCFAKRGGCGFEFAADDTAITEQKIGRVPNEDIPDQYNTVLKMSNKRALVAAVLNVTAASDIFTQDLEDSDLTREADRPKPTREGQGEYAQRTAESGAPVARESSNPEDHRAESELALLLPDEDRVLLIAEIKKLGKGIPAKDKADAAVTYGIAESLESTDTACLSDLLKWMRARVK